MTAKTKWLTAWAVAGALPFLIDSAAKADIERMIAPNGAAVTKIKANGHFAYALLHDGEANGFLNVSRDEINDTTALDFSYAFPNPANADYIILVQGSGEIPNDTFTISATSAHLSATTPFRVIRCDINLIDASFFCEDAMPSTFDLTWTADGFGSTVERLKRTETLGPLRIKSQGEYSMVSAAVIQSWDGRYNATGTGELLDTRGITFIREVTLQPNP